MLRSTASRVALLVVGILATGCAARVTTSDAASGDHAGLTLDVHLHATTDSLVADTTLQNTRTQTVHLDADQCGRVTEVVLARTLFEPEGAAYTGSVGALKRLVLRQQRDGESPDRFAPRQVTGGSDPPPCARPTGPIALPPGARITERWELPVATAGAFAAVGSTNAIVRAEAVESVTPDRLGYLDILPTGDAEPSRVGRSVAVELHASAVIDRLPTRSDGGPSRGQKFDRMIEDVAMRAFIEAQPADSWRRGTITPRAAGPDEFRAVTTGFERAVIAGLDAEGAVTGQPTVPGASDRIRVFARGPATLPPGITLIPEPDAPTPTEDVVVGRLSLPTGRLVADGIIGGSEDALPYPAASGAYPTHVTLVRYASSNVESVALASVVVSEAPTTGWKRGYGIAVDGGTAAFTSLEGSQALGRLVADREADWEAFQDAAFDSLTAHDGLVTESPIGDGLDMVTFSSGLGDGQYDVYVGVDSSGRPTRYVLDFQLLHLEWPDV